MNDKTREPLAQIKAYRRTGGAVVTIMRDGHTRRHCVSLRRYRAFFNWTNVRCPWRCSGAWLRHGLDISVWNEPFPGMRLPNNRSRTGLDSIGSDFNRGEAEAPLKEMFNEHE